MNATKEKPINPLHLQHAERKKLADLRKAAYSLASSLEVDEWIREELDPIAIGETQLALLRFVAYVMRVQGELAEYDRKEIDNRIEHRRELISRELGLEPEPSNEHE